MTALTRTARPAARPAEDPAPERYRRIAAEDPHFGAGETTDDDEIEEIAGRGARLRPMPGRMNA